MKIKNIIKEKRKRETGKAKKTGAGMPQGVGEEDWGWDAAGSRRRRLGLGCRRE